jgi:hypothetical protein
MKLATLCSHVDRKHYSKGLCESCYKTYTNRNNPVARLQARARYNKWKAANPGKTAEYNKKSREKYRAPCRRCGATMPFPSMGKRYCNECLPLVRKDGNTKRYELLSVEWDEYKRSLGCSRCGYNRCGAALDFHHFDDNKEQRITVSSWKMPKSQNEISKCVLLCSNCHREIHNGIKEKICETF